MPLKAVIFDVDGTLADTEDAHRQAFNLTFKEFGLPWHWDVDCYAELLAMDGGEERLLHYARRADPERFAMLGAACIARLLVRLHLRASQVHARRLELGKVPLRPGVARLLHELRAAGVRLAIATTSARADVDVLLATLLGELPADAFDVIGAGEQAAAMKPAPDLHRWVLEKLGLPGADCLAIEDSRDGLRAALGAGIPVLVTECVWTRREDFSGALAVLPDLADVDLALLARLRETAANSPHIHPARGERRCRSSP